ncbi:Protein of unknown function [Bryocella elongata]|uniref:DUF4199 domain-containing protein n=1 Tax=Bryocella elongata TaxID=863522 RepID=A0A1H5W6Y3_9BACT|nr:DUF4199 domain-containing protein [Bryocella elongata]SEF95244.1 Protein of unknown function [Bryocella elongata]
MKKIVLTYGLISGGVMACLMALATVFGKQIGQGHAMYVGYATMVASFLLVYFGIRSYRDTVGGGEVSFGRGVAIGGLIMVFTCVFYVATWEVIYHNFMPHYMDDYAAYMLKKAQDAGETAAQIQAKMAEMEKMKQLYSNPVMNVLMTFLEPLPVGVVMTLVSAGILRRKNKAQAAEAMVS